jgi:hypothetical protein
VLVYAVAIAVIALYGANIALALVAGGGTLSPAPL